jgi:hypothetical protein
VKGEVMLLFAASFEFDHNACQNSDEFLRLSFYMLKIDTTETA